MEVTLKHHTPLHIAAEAIRECWASQDKSDSQLICTVCGSDEWLDGHHCTECDTMLTETICGPNDRALIDRVGNKFKHASTLEHLHYNFKIEGISRACLQELARHRHQSLSVQSTRYTLAKELKHEKSFITLPEN